jgi:hypothetical protein
MKAATLWFALIIILPFQALTQYIIKTDTTIITDTTAHTKSFGYKQLILPVSLMTYGVIGLESDFLKDLNVEIKVEVEENMIKKHKLDNYLQFSPVLAVYGLNLIGIKGKHNLLQRSIMISTSYLVMISTVKSLKKITKVQRPDSGSINSFPSGHTATAFAGAEFLMQEYKGISPWIGVAGYALATTTGTLRILNNRHWITDVAMGAGIGILSTKFSYWLAPKIMKNVFKSKSISERTSLTTNFSRGNQGVRLVLNLR